MISHKYKCIFVEVPKTGSMSLRTILGFSPIPHHNIWQIREGLRSYGKFYGGRARELMGTPYLFLPNKVRNRLGDEIFRNYYKFSFVRNPWDRVVSLYLRKEGIQLREKMSFEKFVDWIKYSSSTCEYPVPQTNQLDWLVDPSGKLLVDFVGKFERLNEDWEIIARNLKINQTLPHKNKNKARTKHYTEFYNTTTRKIIEEKFKIDIEYFGYTFD